ncbi:signal transducer and activator of transcription 5B-like isoform X2 [Daphnia pulex]|uniref:signal transducer and activator of transcription 5B-like isoform X2 n=1 Tax=Daphnia pulex TaxID=6669 RepID=UPI001EDEEE09|nr:signal transducer and activator of transcription 5B-like isoform X2 [Daphnia pulex]XP_046451787.1 signal transducer and activator of transcription 5B-like isoform X2 [Daphnia pulex]XP_046451789.1 signal transducer and activator of transcription 5B-like isoform X2 [Daphnia pulex]XP_046451790.1 signal transducer and activator of transcription 5B-like isoform X2 [Daphnia pulex]
MSLWAKSQQLQGDALRQVQAVYGEHFPIEVRHCLAPWIESKIMSDVDPDNPQHEQYAASVVGSLIQELESKAQILTTEEFFLTKIKLQGAAEMFRQRYNQNPLALLRIIRHCLGTELKLVQQAENMSLGMSCNPSALLPDASGEILQQLEILRQRTQETSEDLRRMEQEQEAFALEYHELTKIQANLTHLQNQAPSQQKNDFEKQLRIKKDMSEHKLNVKLAELLQMRMALAEKHKETLMLIENLQARVLDDELIRWKREQQLAGNGVPFHSNLDSIQEWCEGLAEIIWLNRQQIKEAERLRNKFPIMQANNTDHVPALNTQITQLLSSLVTSTFIIERQPPQVMKTNTRFTAMVRLLVGGKLNVHMTPPQVTVSIISEQQANTLLKNDKMAKGEASGEILNNTGTMEYQKASRQLSVSFRNMQLRKIKRAEKKGTESVMDEKFSLLFQSKFSVGGGELVFQVWTLSLPVVVIVHGNQEPHAWATVTWDNAFAEPGRTPFVVPEKVPWGQVAETLSTKFRSATGRALTESNQRFLASKAFRNPNLQLPLVGPEAANLMLTWSQFCKEPLPERNFTFWEWFYALMKLTREHLRAPWMDNTIVGFIGRKQTEDLLKQCLRGTFMLRFSDSELGGVTIAWVGDNSEVFMLQPFTSKDFAIRTLADRVSDLKHLIYLYPDIPKDQAFGKYYTPFTDSQTPTNGYVKPLLVTHVPGWSSGGGNMESGSYPPTPQGFYNPQSPEASMGRDTPSVHSATSETVNSSFYPSTQTGQPNEISDSFQDFMSQVEELDNLEEFQMDLNTMGVIPAGMTHFKS